MSWEYLKCKNSNVLGNKDCCLCNLSGSGGSRCGMREGVGAGVMQRCLAASACNCCSSPSVRAHVTGAGACRVAAAAGCQVTA